MVRPEHLSVVREGRGISAKVERTTYRGGYWDVFVTVDDLDTSLMTKLHQKPELGEVIEVSVSQGWILPV